MLTTRCSVALTALLVGLAPVARAQTQTQMSFEDYEPRSTLVVPEHPLTRARYPFIDVHNHQDAEELTPAQVDEVVTAMDGLQHGGHGEPERRQR